MHETQERKNARGNQEDLCNKLTLKLNLEVGILQLEMVDGDGISQAESRAWRLGRKHIREPWFGAGWDTGVGVGGAAVGLSTAGPGPRSSFEAEVCCLLGDLW